MRRSRTKTSSQNSRSGARENREPVPSMRTTTEVENEIINVLRTVYEQQNRDVRKTGAESLLQIYSQEADTENIEIFLGDLAYRIELFLDVPSDADGQRRVLYAIALFATRALIELSSQKPLETVLQCLQEKRRSVDAKIRRSVVFLAIRVLTMSIKVPKPEDDIQTFYATHIDPETFSVFYSMLFELSFDTDDMTRRAVVLGFQRLQLYPGIMQNIGRESIESPKQIILLRLRDPSEAVRKAAVDVLDAPSKTDVRFLIDRLINDPSDEVTHAAARRISEISTDLVDKADVRTVVQHRDLFLNDRIDEVFYDMLLSWCADVYRSNASKTHDYELNDAEKCHSIMNAVGYFGYSFAESGMLYARILMRLFEVIFHTSPGSFPDEKVIEFIKLFTDVSSDDYENTGTLMTPLNAFNYEVLIEKRPDFYPMSLIAAQQRRVFFWYVMGLFVNSLPLGEAPKSECFGLLYPSLKDFVDFAENVLATIQEEGKDALIQRMAPASFKYAYNSILGNLLNAMMFLEKDMIGMIQWKNFLSTQLVSENHPLPEDINLLTPETVYTMVDQFIFIHHANEDQVSVAHQICDLVYEMCPMATSNDMTQGLLANSSQELEPRSCRATPAPFDASRPMESNVPTSLDNVPIGVLHRCVTIICGAFKSGFFKEDCTVLEGLGKSFAYAVFDLDRSGTECRVQSLTIIGLLALHVKPTSFNYIRSFKLVLDAAKVEQNLPIIKVALYSIREIIHKFGIDTFEKFYFEDSYDSQEVSRFHLADRIQEYIDVWGRTPLSREVAWSAIRVAMRLVTFDSTNRFPMIVERLLVTVFLPAIDEKLRSAIVAFFICICSAGRSYQVMVAQAFPRVMERLSKARLDTPEAKVHHLDVADFVLDLTCFNMLNVDGFERDHGSAHLDLAVSSFGPIIRHMDDRVTIEVMTSVISRCEVGELHNERTLKDLCNLCDKYTREIPYSKCRTALENFNNRLAQCQKLIEGKILNGRGQIYKPPPPPTVEELGDKIRKIFSTLETFTIDLLPEKVQTLFDDPYDDENDDVIVDKLAKMKIFFSRVVDKRQVFERFSLSGTSFVPLRPNQGSGRGCGSKTNTPVRPVATPAASTRRPKRPRLANLQTVSESSADIDFA